MGADAVLSVESRFKDFSSNGIDSAAGRAISANNAITESAKRQEQQLGRTRETFQKSTGAITQASVALGPLADGMGRTSQAVNGAVTAISLMTSGLGGIGLAIAGATLGLTAFLNYLEKAATMGRDPNIFGDPNRLKQVKVAYEQYLQAAARGSVYELSALKKQMDSLGMSLDAVQQAGGLEGLERSIAAAEKTAKKFNATLVEGAEKRASQAAGGDDPLSKMKAVHAAELAQLSGNLAEKARVEAAHETELAATRKKIRVDFEKEITSLAIDARMSAMQDGEAKELQQIKVNAIKMQVQAMKSGVDRATAEAKIKGVVEEQTMAVHAKYEQKRLDFEKQMVKESAKVKAGGIEDQFDRKKALLELEYEAEIETAEKIGASTVAIEQRYSDLRQQIYKDYNDHQLQEAMKHMEGANSVLSAGFNFASSLVEVERTRDKRRTQERMELIEEQEKLGITSKAEAEQKKRILQEEAEKRERERAKRAKKWAIAEAIANTAVGFTKALAQGGLMGLFTGAAVGLAGAAQLAKIEAQEFEDGGFPVLSGPHGTLIRVNEGNKQEAVLNHSAVRTLGRDNINRLNSGQTVNNQSSTRNEFKYQPVNNFNVTPDTVDLFMQLLDREPEKFFRWADEKRSKGYAGAR